MPLPLHVLQWPTSTDRVECYSFAGARGPARWAMGNGHGLGSTGLWNFFWRIGAIPSISNDLPSIPMAVAVSADDPVPEALARQLSERVEAGHWVICAGSPTLLARLLPATCNVATEIAEYPYAALAYSGLGDGVGIIAPPRFTFARLDESVEIQTFGRLVAIRGERQTPDRALISPFENAPAVVRYKNLIYLNGNAFAGFQAFLQGQEDLTPWLAWRNRFFWLDEAAGAIARILRRAGFPLDSIERGGVPQLERITVVLRHDLDSSRCTDYLDLELAGRLAGVHAILLDDNTRYWVDRLAQHPEQEEAFHYNTIAAPTFLERVAQRIGFRRPTQYRPAADQICGRGLWQQIVKARQHGVGVRTLHRHGPFLLYPEWIDAVDYVLDMADEVLGGSSLFRSQVLRWGTDRADGAAGSVGDFPDPCFPYWFPYRLAHAGDGGRMLRGWETTSVMEIEPELFSTMLDWHDAEIRQRVVTLGYHPYHARRPTFAKSGSLSWFREVLGIIAQRNLQVLPLASIYELASASVRS